MKKAGLIVNPIAGMGGKVGLKGTDGLVEKALALGAVPDAGKKAARAVQRLKTMVGPDCRDVVLMAPPGKMGGCFVVSNGLGVEGIIPIRPGEKTSAEDTVAAATKMMEKGVELILFAGGDGTARDICFVVKEKVPVIGIPAGVKIHSPVFAGTPEKAGELAALYLTGRIKQIRPKEVLDIDEDAYRQGRVLTRLYGVMNIPWKQGKIQNRKAPSPLNEEAMQHQAALDVVDQMQSGVVYLIGPGTTTRPVMEILGLPHTLLGVDIICNKKMLIQDARETQIIDQIRDKKFKIIVTPIGGQGYLFGRGNHQISPKILKKAGRQNVIVTATPNKMANLGGEPLLIDSGDIETDRQLSGYIRVKTGYRQEMMYKIE